MAGIKVVFIVLMCICVAGCDHSLKIKEPQFNKRRTPEHNVQYLDKINAEAERKSLNKKQKKQSQYEFINQEQEAVPEHAMMRVKDEESHNTFASKPKEIWSEEDDKDYEYDDITSMEVSEEPMAGHHEAPIKVIKRHQEASAAKYVQIKPKKTTKKSIAKIQANATTTASVAAPKPTPAPTTVQAPAQVQQTAQPSPPVPQQPLPELQPPISPPLDSGLPPKPNLKINKIPPKTKDAMETQELMEKKQEEAKALSDKAQNLKPVQPQQVAPQGVTQSPPQQPPKAANNSAATPPPAVAQQPLPAKKEEPTANGGSMDDKLQELLKSYDNPTK